MGFAENMRVLRNINCGLQSGVSLIEQRNNGVGWGPATINLFGNLANGITRNEIAYGMQKWGNPMGNLINSWAGYGNPVSNTIGTLGIMSACSTPWMFFNMPWYSMPLCSPGFMMPWGGSISYSHSIRYSC